MKDLHRCNLEEADDGTLRLCRGEHEKCADCEWEEYVPAERADSLKRLLGEARDAFKQIAHNPGNSDDTGFTSGHISRDLLARIDATLDPDYVDAPMQVSVTTIDPVTGEVKQGVATTDEELRTLLDDERDVVAFPGAHRADPFDDDLDEPLPPKQCDLEDPNCEACQ